MSKTDTKFKVGDIVRGISDRYLITDRGMTRGEVVAIRPYNFSVKILEHEMIPGEVGNMYSGLEYKDFELVESDPEDLLSVEETWQWMKTHYADEHFDNVFGSGTCLDDIPDTFEEVREKVSEYEKKEREKESLYNGKVVCLDPSGLITLYTKGKIYQFRDGFIISDVGERNPLYPCHSFKEWENLSDAKWLEVVE